MYKKFYNMLILRAHINKRTGKTEHNASTYTVSESILDATKVGLEINTDTPKYLFMSQSPEFRTKY